MQQLAIKELRVAKSVIFYSLKYSIGLPIMIRNSCGRQQGKDRYCRIIKDNIQ